VLKYVPLLEQEFGARKQPVGPSWRMDGTYVRVKGTWKYLYRAVDKAGATADFLLTAKGSKQPCGVDYAATTVSSLSFVRRKPG
jgi:transposase-like protein